jgi:hypothetical protein
MMARVVAELGRPETPEEAAARKAESSRIYRSSQSFRNLIAALVVTLLVVAVVIFGVPRGEVAEAPAIDPAAEASALSNTLERPVLSATVPEDWRVTSATFDSSDFQNWTVAYAPPGDSGFLRVSQGFDADDAWVTEILRGNRSAGTVDAGGVAWDEYRISDPEGSGNVSYALSTAAGADRVVVYGSTTPAAAQDVAESLADGIRDLRAAS